MRMKALGVALMVGFAAFTTFYWITDAPRRDASTVVTDEDLLEFGELVFLPDDTYTIEIVVTDDGFTREIDDPETGEYDLIVVPATELDLFVNTSLSLKNETGGEVTVRGDGARSFELQIADGQSSPVKFDGEGETTVSGTGIAGTLLVTAGPPHLEPYGANCARCHGVEGMGGPIPGDPENRSAPSLRTLSLANKWLQTGGAQGLNNYVAWVITLGGVVRSGQIDSPMPAWGQEYGGPLTRQQIEALTALIGTWAQETLDNPPDEDVPDTVEAGATVYVEAGCVACHGADLEGGVGPNLQTIGSSLVTEGLVTDTLDLEQMQADYDEDPRMFLELWIRDSWGNYHNGEPTAMPQFPEEELSASRLTALITFLLSHTE